jgi:hypothetical protein
MNRILLIMLLAAILCFLPRGLRAEKAQTSVWRAGPPLLLPGEKPGLDTLAVKDPSIVYYEGQWHVFYTAADNGEYRVAYVASARLDSLQRARRYPIGSHYSAAPQVFYFRPQKRWYLIYQTRGSNYQPVCRWTENISNPDSWSEPENLAEKEDREKWIDFWLLCDAETAYFYYTRSHDAVYMMTTPITRFPEGFGNPQKVFGSVHEAVHVYKVKGRDAWHMVYEMRDSRDIRHFGLAAAPHPGGPWETADARWAEGAQLRFPDGVTPWTQEVSHGELIRAGYDERLEYDPAETRMLIQGMTREAHTGPYHKLVWRLGLIERVSGGSG